MRFCVCADICLIRDCIALDRIHAVVFSEWRLFVGYERVETGISGWLLLPAVGMPLSFLLHSAGVIMPFAGAWSHGFSGVLVAAANLIVLGVLIRAMVSFYQRRPDAPARVKDFLLSSMLLVGVCTLVMMACPQCVGGLEREGEWIVVLWGVLVFFIAFNSLWITYFNRSERVRYTFPQ